MSLEVEKAKTGPRNLVFRLLTAMIIAIIYTLWLN